MPNSVSSQVGTIGYDGLVSAFSRILVSYDKYGKMPKYVYVKSLSGGKTKVTGNLNSKNTIGNLAAYLAASKNCEVNDAKIKKLVTKLTKNCGTDKEKADAIFKYVRDAIGYSFYYNTKYGAAGTLKTKSGNCVDLSHLLVAMYRNAGLAARYGHGKCTFSSGNTYGHVWTQVLIGNTWTVADATSSRNSLGHVANWNVKSYSLEGYFSSISF
ncbi:transglutaminase domain-containing protein [Methanobrevibacter sp. V14]|uniref:transglutaminase domain-containing protein n=1 Tax=Methanobrevibacter sp. V14 TaxID=3064280 RepID=UPI00273392FA|nr:transglutaminase domain-containing protein [Methanobrevibacter sp. V14]